MLVGFTGPAGSGKDTCAQALVRELGYTRLSFAGPIRDMLEVLINEVLDEPCNWSDREWVETPLDTIGVSPRRLMQTLGTEWGRRMVHPNLWVIALDAMNSILEEDRLVISDVRFENEADYILSKKGIVIRLEVNGEGLSTLTKHNSHESEKGIIPKFLTYHIAHPRGDPKGLEAKAVNLVRAALGKRA